MKDSKYKKFIKKIKNTIFAILHIKPKRVNFNKPTYYDLYEVVYTDNCLSVGLLSPNYAIIYSRADHLRNDRPEYGGIHTIDWYHTGIFMSYDKWYNLTLDKSTDDICRELKLKIR